ncbi:hypothetical protein AWC15_15740 [Mycobacterium lacus]|nr:hypothetical protein AWC15_15740 [Mycobacterium lacus]
MAALLASFDHSRGATGASPSARRTVFDIAGGAAADRGHRLDAVSRPQRADPGWRRTDARHGARVVAAFARAGHRHGGYSRAQWPNASSAVPASGAGCAGLEVARHLAPPAEPVPVHREGEFVVATVIAYSNLLPTLDIAAKTIWAAEPH